MTYDRVRITIDLISPQPGIDRASMSRELPLSEQMLRSPQWLYLEIGRQGGEMARELLGQHNGSR